MKVDLELVLAHDGTEWIARNGSVVARGRTLSELDRELERILAASGKYRRGTRVLVLMGFDNSTIPTWIRQYAAHYFNRYVSIEV